MIAGGGLAGLTAAIHLSKAGFNVTVIEKNPYPHHKVCGEYISNEVVPYLRELGVYPATLQPTQINKFQFSSTSGKLISAPLPLGGFGLSRYAFDHFLMQKALEYGCRMIQDTVLDIQFKDNDLKDKSQFFEVQTARHGTLNCSMVIAAYGKRTTLDNKLNRAFMKSPSPWLAVKAHYRGSFDDTLVALHHFKGGYCGVSMVENNLLNICYLTDYVTFKKYRSLEEFQQQVLYKNKHLRTIFENSRMEFEVPLSIGQISFQEKEAVAAHILMIGDAAGLIHPLCGNGMSMAIHSAKICAEQVIHYLSDEKVSRKQMEQTYSHLWRHHFKDRLYMGKILAALLRKEKIADMMTSSLANFPFILPQLIKRTHGYQL
ncbi:NAD(P)/FAD-dependent oxidoreductase [Pedobacter immunditicola]|uniref:NAD(P)/FAD-dependent oxidoreductase n=1 Tax=Pedobacter immunditicola TaxID=3133440 RepID=UPI0030B07510